MSNKFLELLQCFTDKPLEGNMGDFTVFEEVVQQLELILNPKNKEELRLFPNKVCPLVSSGAKLKYVILGLNPHDDGEAGDLQQITTWEELAQYHVPANLSEDNIFHRVLSPNVVNYYQRVAILISSLEESKLIEWKTFNKGLSKEATTQKYMKMIEKTPIGIVEMIPFASKGIISLQKRGMQKLITNVVGYRSYLHSLIEYIFSSSADDAWIICNGGDACEAFEIIMNNEGTNGVSILNERDEKKYSLLDYKGKKVLMLHHFLRGHGKLNSYEEIGAMINDVSAAAHSHFNSAIHQ